MKTTLLFALLTLTFMGIFYATTKGTANSAATTTFKVNLTGKPFTADEINIEIKEVRIKYMDDPGQWIVIPAKAGVYNLATEGEQFNIASGNIPANTLGEIRLVFGTNNSIKLGNEVYPLIVDDSMKNGLSIKAGRKLQQGNNEVTVNINAATSVHQQEDGTYILNRY